MEYAEVLNDLGFPMWVIGLALVALFLERIGLFNFIKQQVSESSEFEREQAEARAAAEQSEQVALWSQMTNLQTKALEQNELLLEFVINQISERQRDHDKRLGELFEGQRKITYELREMATKFTILVGIHEREYDARKSNDG